MIKRTRKENFQIEKDIEKSILHYLRLINIVSWKQNNGAFTTKQGGFVRAFKDSYGQGVKGLPDIAGYLPDGRALYIEVKRQGGVVSKEQKNFILNASESGCVAFVARSVDDVIENLKGSGV